ncbi:MAG: HPr(Ser) kinase/phosphatase [Gammaproteobacteria bacterium]
MTEPITARRMFDSLQLRLGLTWAGGKSGGERTVNPLGVDETGTTLVGHLNFIHPSRVQVLGESEIEYLHSLDPNSYNDAIRRLFSSTTAVVLIADARPVPEEFFATADENNIPLFASQLDSNLLITNLQYFLSHLLAEKITLHGVFMEVMGLGVLLSGEASIGKSELALELITRGHRLIADDAPEFSRAAPDLVSGTCPDVLREFLEVRGLGIINVRAMFGDSAIKSSKYLRLVIRLENMSDEQLRDIDRLQGNRRTRRVLGVEIPELTLPVAPGRNLAVLVETAVRNHVLSLKGYEAYRDFMKRQSKMLNRGAQ